MEYIRNEVLEGIKLLLEGIEGIEGTESTKGKKFICKLVGKAYERVEGLKTKGLEKEQIKQVSYGITVIFGNT